MAPHLKSMILCYITTVPITLTFLEGLVDYVKNRGSTVHVISSPEVELGQFGQRHQVAVHGVPMPRKITPFKDLVALFRTWQVLRRIKPTVVHAQTPKGGLIGITAAWLAGVPIRVYHIYGLPHMTAHGYRRLLLMLSEKLTCRLANRVFSVTASIQETAVTDGLCPPDKINVIAKGGLYGINSTTVFNPAALPENTRAEVRAQYGIPDDALAVGFVGRLVRDKGVVELAEAWQTLREAFPKLHLVIIGEVEPRDPIPETVLELFQQDDHVHMIGRVDNKAMPRVYTAIDLLVLPSYREGFGTVLLEAAAMELPVVVSNIPGCIDVVQPGITATLVTPRDGAALADGIRQYLDNSELRKKHGEAGRKFIVETFQPEPLWAATYEEYINLLQENA